MKIGGLKRMSLIDYPGKIAATVFVAGCGFRCGWCHNSELVLPEKIKNQPEIKEKDLFDFLDSRQGLLEGVCLTGGEPSLYPDLPAFIRKIKQKGFLVKLDTNGSNPKILQKLFQENLIDFVAMDIKSSSQKYALAASQKINLDDIQKSVDLIKQSGLDYEFRTTVVPGLVDEKAIREISQWLKGARRFVLQQFNSKKTLDKSFQKIKPYSEEKLKMFVRLIEPFVDKVILR